MTEGICEAMARWDDAVALAALFVPIPAPSSAIFARAGN